MVNCRKNGYTYQKPQQLYFYVTRRCNMRCPHCLFRFYDKNLFSDDDIDLSKAKEILTHFYHDGTKKLSIVAEGEVLLYNYFREILIFSREVGFEEINTFTNGLLLHKYIDCIIENINSIYISVDGYSNETYQSHRRVDGAYDKIISNITTLVKAKKTSTNKLVISIAYVVYEQNLHSLEKMIHLAEDLGVDRIEFFNFHSLTANYPEHTPLYATNTKAVEDFHKIMSATNYTVEIILPSLLGNKKTYHCYNLFNYVIVGAKGFFSPCCHIPPHNKYGNFFNDPKVFNRNEIMKFKENFSSVKNLEDLQVVCKGCMALSSENYIFFPYEHVWKKRELIDNYTYSFSEKNITLSWRHV